MTEDEAKTKWCPFVRIDFNQGIAWNNRASNSEIPDNNKIATCLGSECMAWRWEPHERVPGDDEGYCGLAGKP